jgi:hypothetical protein
VKPMNYNVLSLLCYVVFYKYAWKEPDDHCSESCYYKAVKSVCIEVGYLCRLNKGSSIGGYTHAQWDSTIQDFILCPMTFLMEGRLYLVYGYLYYLRYFGINYRTCVTLVGRPRYIRYPILFFWGHCIILSLP